MPERMDHNRGDALDITRALCNLDVRAIVRRMKSTAETYVNQKFDEAQANGTTFHAEQAAREGHKLAQDTWLVDNPELEATVVEELEC